jgi:serine protease Do
MEKPPTKADEASLEASSSPTENSKGESVSSHTRHSQTKLSPPRRLTWLLLGFFMAIATLAWQNKPEPVYQHAQLSLPSVEAPTGEFAKVYELARPATVQIVARSSDPSYLGAPIGIGTGFFITSDGYVLTAYHVVDKSDIGSSSEFRRSIEYVAISPDETEYPLELVGFDAYFDLAVLKATVPGTVPFVPLATGSSQVGERIVAIGNSRGDFLQGRAGVISRIGVTRPRARFADGTIELSAALAPGDSGGPILNRKGEAIGVVSFISFLPDRLTSETDGVVPPFLRGVIGEQRDFAAYAVPVSADSEMIAALRMGDRNDIPVMGFSWAGVNYNPRDRRLQLGERPGPVVQEVQANSPAERAGLESLQVVNGELVSADVIVAIDDEPTETFDELLELVYLKGVGETVIVTVQRGDATFKLTMELGAKSEVFN